LTGTRDITSAKDKISIGANVTLATLAEHAEVRKLLPGLAQAMKEGGTFCEDPPPLFEFLRKDHAASGTGTFL
jgi:hypothetical protein